MRRFTIMGFTEAELGFVIAALFVAIAITAVHDRDASAENVRQHESVADSLAAELGALRAETGALRAEAEVLRDSLAALVAKISTKVPQCWEKGEPREPIARMAVIGADRYVLDRDTLTIAAIRERFAEHIERGAALGCRYVMNARPTRGIDAVQQSAAVWRLRTYFDVNDRPQ